MMKPLPEADGSTGVPDVSNIENVTHTAARIASGLLGQELAPAMTQVQIEPMADHDPAIWQLCSVEVADDDHLRLEDLTPAEQAKIRLIAVTAEHTPEYFARIVSAMGPIDYYIGERMILDPGTLHVWGNRRNYDLASNLLARRERVALRQPQGGEVIEKDRLPDGDILEMIVSKARGEGRPVPILRSIDVIGTDPSPLPAFRTMHEVMEYCDALDHRMNSGLYTEDNETLIALRAEITEIYGVTSMLREQVQIDELSRIIASAVRRHPEMPTIAFGVMVGEIHAAVYETLFEGTDVQSLPKQVSQRDPTAVRQFMPTELPARLAKEGIEPTDDELRLSLLYQYMDECMNGFGDRLLPGFKRTLLNYMDSLPPSDVATYLQRIQELKERARRDRAGGHEMWVAITARESIDRYIQSFPGMETAMKQMVTNYAYYPPDDPSLG